MFPELTQKDRDSLDLATYTEIVNAIKTAIDDRILNLNLTAETGRKKTGRKKTGQKKTGRKKRFADSLEDGIER
jgi:hypothetical protein